MLTSKAKHNSFDSVLSYSFYILSRLHVSKHALLVSIAKIFSLETWLPSLNLATKFELGDQV
jgi:hypothetical protein